MEIRLGDWLSQGWQTIKNNLPVFAVAALLTGIAVIIVQRIMIAVLPLPSDISAGIASIVVNLISAPCVCGLYIMAFQQMRGRPPTFADFTSGFSRYGNAVVAAVVVALIAGIPATIITHILMPSSAEAMAAARGGQVGVGLLVAMAKAMSLTMICQWLVGSVTFFVLPAIADSNTDAFTAIQRSVNMALRNLPMMLVLTLVLGLLAGVGVLVCCVGALVTIPWVLAAQACAYRDIFGVSSLGIPPGTAAPKPPSGYQPPASTVPPPASVQPTPPAPPTPPPAPLPPQTPPAPTPPQPPVEEPSDSFVTGPPPPTAVPPPEVTEGPDEPKP
jgi:hypothetical protein